MENQTGYFVYENIRHSFLLKSNTKDDVFSIDKKELNFDTVYIGKT